MINLRKFCLVLAAAFYIMITVIVLSVSEQKEFIGQMKHSLDSEGIFLVTADGLERIDLFFLYDDGNLIIDDFGRVQVKGQYYEIFNILKVEEITESTPLPALCYVRG